MDPLMRLLQNGGPNSRAARKDQNAPSVIANPGARASGRLSTSQRLKRGQPRNLLVPLPRVRTHDHGQKMKVAASVTAVKKTTGHRSWRAATRRQSLRRPNMISIPPRRRNVRPQTRHPLIPSAITGHSCQSLRGARTRSRLSQQWRVALRPAAHRMGDCGSAIAGGSRTALSAIIVSVPAARRG